MKVIKELVDNLEKANRDIELYIESIVKKGDTLIWVKGSYEGRRAVVERTYWNDWKNEIEVYVRTYDRYNKRLMNTTDYSHHLSDFNIKQFLFKKELKEMLE